MKIDQFAGGGTSKTSPGEFIVFKLDDILFGADGVS
jgi:hypothetical protein